MVLYIELNRTDRQTLFVCSDIEPFCSNTFMYIKLASCVLKCFLYSVLTLRKFCLSKY